MPDHTNGFAHRNGQAVNPNTQHESSDANVRAIVWFGVGLIAFGVVAHLLALAMLDWCADVQKQQDKPLPPLAKKERLVLPRDLNRIPGPVLQQSEERDLDALRKEEVTRLKQYGWVNRQDRTVHVPIDEAIAQMAEPKFAAKHGISVRPAAESERLRKLEAPRPAVTAKGGGK